jgi:hypothetical protein
MHWIGERYPRVRYQCLRREERCQPGPAVDRSVQQKDWPCSLVEVDWQVARHQEPRGEVGCFPEGRGEEQEHRPLLALLLHVEGQVGLWARLHEGWGVEVLRAGIQGYYHTPEEAPDHTEQGEGAYLSITLEKAT